MVVSPDIQVRDLRFPLEAVPRDWHPAGVAVTAYWDQLSVFFPVGEGFFVRSVRHYLDQLPEGRLRDEVAAFSAQEGHHAREHQAYNDHLAAQGLPIAKLEAVVRFVLGRAQRVLSPRKQLAITCALEHFTSLMGEHLLSHPEALEGADPTMHALWRWHAAEENEHRSVAWDVFTAMGGTWFERARLMIVTSIFFWALVSMQLVVFLKHRGALFSPRAWWSLVRFWFLEPAALGTLIRPWFGYFRPGFHPAARGGFELVEQWRRSVSS